MSGDLRTEVANTFWPIVPRICFCGTERVDASDRIKDGWLHGLLMCFAIRNLQGKQE